LGVYNTRVERIVLETLGVRREYRLFDPGCTGTPLLVFLHGRGATAEWADDETGWSRLAARERFALALPEALPPDPSRPPKFLTNPQHWSNDSDEVVFLTTVIHDAVTRTGAEAKRVFVAGFSNGAAMTFRLAAERADLLAGIAPVAGYCYVPDPKPARPLPTLYVIGAADPLVPLRGGEVPDPWRRRYVRREPVAATLERWAAAIGCAPVPRAETDSGGVRTDTYPGPVVFRSVVIDGLGHHWPGGKGGLNHRIAGPLSNAVDGTELLWAFFRSL
jgi:polyhydroxybutyrate depolymerase